MKSDYYSIYLTHPNLKEAEAMAQDLVEKKLIACANIIPGARSIYEWEGKICNDEEVILFLKTKKILFEECRNQILKLHPYEIPAIMALPLDRGHPDYLNWIHSQTL